MAVAVLATTMVLAVATGPVLADKLIVFRNGKVMRAKSVSAEGAWTLVDLGKGATVGVRTADEQHRRLVQVRIDNSRHRVGVGDAARDGGDPGPTGESPLNTGHVCGRLLISHIHQPQTRLAGGVIERVKPMPAQRRDPLRAAFP